ncbi:MAG: FtsW/RodA/SpoVE family cell cycle protein [Oligosphaeraceae bacterium]
MRLSASHLLYLLAIGCLCALGVAYIYSTGYLGEAFAVRQNYLRQCAFLGLGGLLGMGMACLPTGRLSWRLVVFSGYGISLLLLVAVLLWGRSIGGARRWIPLGGMLLQPAEFARVFTILSGALLLDGKSLPRLWELPMGLLCYLLPMALVAAEPSYGNAASLAIPLAITLGLRYLPPWLWKLSLLGMAALLLTTALAVHQFRRQDAEGAATAAMPQEAAMLLKGYHLRRFQSFLSAQGGWNEQQATMAVAGGGLTGKGYLNGTMKNLGFLPRTVAPTDFLFAVVAEEGGFLFGVLPLLGLYWILLMLPLHWARRAKSRLHLNLLLSGVGLLLVHIVVGVGMSVRLLPVIGLPLPLLSYGGSFTLSVLLLLGSMAGADAHGRKEGHASRPRPREEATFQLGRLFRLKIQEQ